MIWMWAASFPDAHPVFTTHHLLQECRWPRVSDGLGTWPRASDGLGMWPRASDGLGTWPRASDGLGMRLGCVYNVPNMLFIYVTYNTLETTAFNLLWTFVSPFVSRLCIINALSSLVTLAHILVVSINFTSVMWILYQMCSQGWPDLQK